MCEMIVRGDHMNKKRLFCVSLALVSALALFSCAQTSENVTTDTSADTTPDTTQTETVGGITYGDVHISSISELNCEAQTDSHANAVGKATFEANFREFVEVHRKHLGTTTPYYPRLKQTADGGYILFYNTGETGPSVKYITSTDLVNWSDSQFLFEQTSTTQYATCDAVVLEGGDILAVASFRPKSWGSYTSEMDKSGLVLRRSTDGGKTWSDMQTIYLGMNWEPYIMQLSSGEVQVYFTHTAPYTYLYGYNETIRSSGSAIIRSFDNGKTWTPNVTSAPYAADRVMQTYIGMQQGHKFFNDQMPVATQLHNGNIMLACETLDLQKQFRISVGISYDNWKTPLGIEEEGPSDKFVTKTHGSGPYTAQMESGETLISYNGNGMHLLIGDCNGKNFSEAIKPFDGLAKTYWGSLEVVGTHKVMSVHDDDSKVGNIEVRRITYGSLYLNHDLASDKHAVTLDGNSAEWKDNTDAVFVGSVSQAQASVRFTEDDENIYILVERLDQYLDEVKDSVSVFVASEGGEEYYKVVINAKGISNVQKFVNKRPSDHTGDFEAKVICVGTVGNDDDTDTGYSAEIRLKKADLGITTEKGLRTTLLLSNKDVRTESDSDNILGHNMTDMSTWQYVSFK